jgi:hypothetical protein
MNLVWWSGTGLLEGAAEAITSLVPGNSYQVSFHAINDQGLYSYGDPAFLEASINGDVLLTTPELFSGQPWRVIRSPSLQRRALMYWGSGWPTAPAALRAAWAWMRWKSPRKQAFPTGTTAVSVTATFRPGIHDDQLYVTLGKHHASWCSMHGKDGVGHRLGCGRMTVSMAGRQPGVYLYREFLADGRSCSGRVMVEVTDEAARTIAAIKGSRSFFARATCNDEFTEVSTLICAT